jgi:integrase/recombinase XerD
MRKYHTNIEELIVEATSYLQQQSFAENSIGKYCSTWNQLKEFMKLQQLQIFNAVAGEKFLQFKLGNYKYEKLSSHYKHLVRRVTVLTEFQETGSVLKKRKTRETELTGPIGSMMSGFIAHNTALGFAESTLHTHRLYLSRFLDYLNVKEIVALEMINHVHLITFANEYGNNKPSVKHGILSVIRGFFRYLYDEHILDVDYSKNVPRDNFRRHSKLPSVYTKEEITSMIEVIDRGNPKGKRDYAIILIASRLGLRSSDICNIKFENLNWKQCEITISQQKTRQEVTLPLTTEIGEAIIDYLKYARPVSKLTYVFLNLLAPFDKMTSINLSSSVSKYLQQAGIKINDRKHGMHILRHSLADILLKEKTPLPVISEVLGHKNTCSTMYYLRIDLDSLRQCALNVPAVLPAFYSNITNLYFNPTA